MTKMVTYKVRTPNWAQMVTGNANDNDDDEDDGDDDDDADDDDDEDDKDDDEILFAPRAQCHIVQFPCCSILYIPKINTLAP